MDKSGRNSTSRALEEAVRFADECAERVADPVRGAHHTPWPVARWVAAQLLADEPVSTDDAAKVVLDPSCGVGHLLLAVRELVGRRAPHCWLGWDVDPRSAEATRQALWRADGRAGHPDDFTGVRCLDPLLTSAEPVADWLIANPPFLSVRSLAREQGADYVAAIREAEPGLKGSFDLYTPFLLRFRRWLRADGRFAAIVPATLWSAGYAREARRVLAGHVEAVHALTPEGLFPGRAVHVDVIVGGSEGRETARLATSGVDGAEPRDVRVVSSDSLANGLPGPPTAAAVPLSTVATITAGTPGYRAKSVGEALREARPGDEADPTVRPFVVTRSVQRYRLVIGPARFLGATYRSPVLPLDAVTEGKAELFAAPKILVGGVSRGLVAARDRAGVALGVNVFTVRSERLTASCLLGLLNAECVGAWYRARFRGRRLSGGYYAVNRAQLGEVPVPLRWLRDPARSAELAALVEQREAAEDETEQARGDAAIEALVAHDLFTV